MNLNKSYLSALHYNANCMPSLNFVMFQLANCISGLDQKVKDLQQMLMSGEGEEGK